MSGGGTGDKPETLFSLEFLVENIRVDKDCEVSDELALGVRLLDFPTLLIYQPQHRSGSDTKHPGEQERDPRRDDTFNRGKSCFFLMNLNSLHTHLSTTPLYAMVLDVKEEIPKLVGSSLISLAKVMDRIAQDVAEHGVSAPSAHGERGHVGMCSLTGETTGSISLSYKLLSLGTSLLPHAADRAGLGSNKVHVEHHVQESVKKKNTDSLHAHSPTPDESDGGRNIQNTGPASANILRSEEKQGDAATEHKPRAQIPQTLPETGDCFEEEDLTIFRPPHLYYSHSAEAKGTNKGWDYKRLTLDSEAFTFEDSEDEVDENNLGGPSFPALGQRVKCDTKIQRRQETSGVGPSALGEALCQLPLLNALLVELSNLNDQSQNHPMSIHPNLAWIYRPVSTEPSAGHGDALREPLGKTRPGTSPHFKHLHSPRNCSTPTVRPTSVQKKDTQEEASIARSKSTRKKLVYGTTRTFNLRLKQISTVKVKRRECTGLIQAEKQTSVAKENTISKSKILKTSQGKSVLNQSASYNANIETVIQSITVDSETTRHRWKNVHGKVNNKIDSDSLRISEEASHSEGRDLKCIHIPSVDRDSAAKNKDKSEHNSESDRSQSESDRRRGKIQSSGSSTHSRPKSSLSGASGEGNEDADYADDFNSLEPSDAYSPDPASSPEPSRAKAPRSPVHPDFHNPNSGSESARMRAVLPVPLKAPSSPQQSLRATHIIRPRTQASALSFSTDDGDRDRSASLQTICSRKHKGSRAERSSSAESFASSRGQRSKSTKNSGPVRGLSAESTSSLEPQEEEEEELEDDLGSLDFRKQYQHISELVANKLPGYTI